MHSGAANGRLPLEDELLLILRDELFQGSWDRLEVNLVHDRQRSYLNSEAERRIEADLQRLRRLREMEELGGVNLLGLRALGAS